jgi:hypothetical protein
VPPEHASQEPAAPAEVRATPQTGPGLAPAGPGARSLPPLSRATLLRLQASAGNSAVGALLGARAPERALARTVNLGPQHNLSKLCFNPMALAGPGYAGAFGLLAHAFIANDYESRQRVTRNVNVYFEDSLAGPIDPRFAAFIIRKNPTLPAWAKVFLATFPVRRPDALLHSTRRQEFDEFKPDSPLGVLDGLQKLGEVSLYVRALGLPYVIGHSYVPSPNIPMFSTTVGGIPVALSLDVRRLAPGLIVYEYCITTDWGKVAWAALIAAILAILAIIFRGRIPVPGPSPVPAPIPIPVVI